MRYDHLLTYTQAGAINLAQLDLDNDGHYGDPGRWEDDRTFNEANELIGRDTDNDSTDDYSPAYDEAGNMTDDDQYNTYEYDVWGRLRFVYNQSSDLVAEYRYNGLNQRISMHQDTDADGDVDSSDITFYFVHDDRWRVIATYHEDDDTGGTDGPKEQFIHHAAGVAGNGSYIDDVICRLKDANTAWTSASDKTLEERIYYCQNWRHDVVALIDSAGEMVEQARYEAYGTPIGMPLGDVNMDGRVTSADTTQISTWDSGGTYDVRGDLDLNGDVNTTDYNISDNRAGTRLGRGVLSDDPDTVGNRNGYAGYIFDDKFGFETFHVRFRWCNASLARWLTRDPLEYVDGTNLVAYSSHNPIVISDPTGLWPPLGSTPVTLCRNICYLLHPHGPARARCLIDCRQQYQSGEAARCCQIACANNLHPHTGNPIEGELVCCKGKVIPCVCWDRAPILPHPDLPGPPDDYQAQYLECIAQQEDCIWNKLPTTCDDIADGHPISIVDGSPAREVCEEDVSWEIKCGCVRASLRCVESIVCTTPECEHWQMLREASLTHFLTRHCGGVN